MLTPDSGGFAQALRPLHHDLKRFETGQERPIRRLGNLGRVALLESTKPANKHLDLPGAEISC